MMAKGTVFVCAAAILAVVLVQNADAFVHRSSIVCPANNNNAVVLFMGKQQTMPGPAGKASSGKATSDYRQKKMSDRLRKKNKKKKNKKGGGFNSDDDDASSSNNKKKSALMEIELVAEPEGGVELSVLEQFAAAEEEGEEDAFEVRIKDMGVVDSESDADAFEYGKEEGLEIHNFWLTAIADGGEIGSARNTLLRDAAKHANFPGFRKGQIPPYAQPKMTNFALQDAVINGCTVAMKRFGVNILDAEKVPKDSGLADATFLEDLQKTSNKYNIKTCPSVPFTATFRGTLDPDSVVTVAKDAESAIEEVAAVVEAEIVEEKETTATDAAESTTD